MPPAFPHGDLYEVMPEIFFVQGCLKISPPPMRFSRNMTVVRRDGALTIINSMRLDEKGLEALDALGRVEHVVRIAGFHGMDDRFYKERYDAKVWAVEGHIYTRGFNVEGKTPEGGYFQADVSATAETELPIPGSRLIVIPGKVPEGVLYLPDAGGTLVTGDALQNWNKPDDGFNWFTAVMMRLMGFIKAHNVGPGWLKQAKPDTTALGGLLDVDFDNVLPAHGAPVVGGAKAAFTPALKKATGR